MKNNPDKGYYNTSNEFQIPRGWPFTQALHYVWTDPYRAQDSVCRSAGIGAANSAVADMVRLQNNEMSIPARSLTPLFRDLDIDDPVVKKAADRLLHWDHVLDEGFRREAGIYEMFQRHLG